MWGGLIFDGDDTLWETECLYDEARQAARAVVELGGFDGARWEALERARDVENVALLGHGAERFPRSCIEAYEELCREGARPVDAVVRREIAKAAGQVFERPARLVHNARETLEKLRQRGYRLALLTKGDPVVQQRRIDESGLADLFEVIEIVEQKTPEVIARVADQLNLEADSVLSVGNSVRSDVLPSLAASIQPIWIDAHVWEYERQHPELERRGVIELDRLDRVLEIAA